MLGIVDEIEEEIEGEIDDEFDEDNEIVMDEAEISSRRYRLNPRIDYMQHWDDDEFKKRFRMSKETIKYILSLIEPQLQHSSAFKNR